MLSWLKAMIRDHFGFSKAETNGILLLLLLTSTCLLAPQALKWYHSKRLNANYDQDVALLERNLALLKAQAHTAKTTDLTKSNHASSTQAARKSRAKVRPSQHLLWDINTADETQLKTIQGIGPALSPRIMKFRNRLGGFIDQAQYQEVYGLQAAVIERLKKHTYIHTDFQPTKLNVNTADFQTLAAHPYISYQQAQSIVRYRAQHGPFATLEELGSLVLLDKATLEKLKPYLTTL